jgi:acetyl esterase/lipase
MEEMSLMAHVAETILRIRNQITEVAGPQPDEFLQKRAKVEDEPLRINMALFGDQARLTTFHKMQLITFGNAHTAKQAVIYMHGGAYVSQMYPSHLVFCRELARQSGAYVLMPVYPLAPNHTYQETYKLITALYKDLLHHQYEKITLMGDSAGGGFVIAFCQYLLKHKLPQPFRLIAISPWVDISMSGSDYAKYEAYDPMLKIPDLKVMGKAWAGDTDVKDPMVSPSFGDNHGLAPTLIFVGTYEIFYGDIVLCAQRMKADGVKVRLEIGEKMTHVYPIYPIPEAKESMRIILEEMMAKDPE